MKLVHIDTTPAQTDAPLTATTMSDDFATTLVMAGEVDMATAPILRSVLADITDLDPVTLILDLSRLDFLSAAGAISIISAVRTLHRTVIVTDSSAVIRPLTLLGVGTTLEMYATTGDARAALEADSSVDGRVAG